MGSISNMSNAYLNLERNEEVVEIFWRGQLKGLAVNQFPALSSLGPTPTGHTPNGHTPNGDAVLSFKIVLPELGSGVTATTKVRVTWAIMLAAYSESIEVAFSATPNSGQAVTPKGQHVAEVPVQVTLDWEMKLQDFLLRVQGQFIESTTSKQIKLQRNQHVGKNSEQACQFQSVLVIRTQEQKGIGEFDGSDTFHKCAMLVECLLQSNEVQLNFRIDSTVVNSEAAKQIARQFEQVLRGICSVDGQNKTISEFKVINMRDLLDIWGWNATVPETVDACVHDIFAQTVQRQPDTLAISAWDGDLTYSELDNLSTRLAHNLVEFGVGLDTIVPLYFEKSMWMPVAQLGVMKAGGASVALDSTQPLERVRSIVQQVEPQIILTSATNEVSANRLTEKPVRVVDKQHLAQLNHVAEKKLPSVSSFSRLYVVFTSGSTGTPKGAIISHSNFMSAIKHQQLSLKFTVFERVFDFSSYSFDVAWSNFLHTIMAGGCLCIPSEEERKGDLVGALHKYRVEYAHITPSLAWFSQDLPQSLRKIHFSGEELQASTVKGLVGKVTIINSYGPAECSVTSTAQEVKIATDQNPEIGYGLGTCTWVVTLDGSDLVPIGAVGELWLEGPVVGQGYLNDPKKTAAAFVEDPPWLLRGGPGHPGRRGRLYRTGDLVRYNGNGCLTFAGRKDSQVKIRGQRVELGEIEHHLRNNLVTDRTEEKVQVIADMIKPRGSDHPTLIAFICIRHDSQESEEDIKAAVRKATAGLDDRLKKTIPIYMIPSVYIAVDSFPMTATGKTDRRRLRNMGSELYWEQLATEEKPNRVLPASQLELNILKVWSGVLNVPEDKISTDAVFTRLGGDSITAMQVVSRCRAQNISVTVGDILRLRTIRALASHGCAVVQKTLAVSEEDVEGRAWPVSPMQQLFFDAHPQGLNHYTQSFILKLMKRTTHSELCSALSALMRRHGMLRARFRKRDDNKLWEQFIAPDSASSFLVEEHLGCDQGSMQVIANERQAKLDLLHGPVFAADLFSCECEEVQTLLLSAHHIVIDLVSWRVIWHDLSQCLSGGPSLPPAAISFQTWCRVQREEGHELDPAQVLPHSVHPAQFEYWGISSGDNRFADSKASELSLDSKSTALLLDQSNDCLRTETPDILVGTLVHSFRRAFPDRTAPAVFLEGHGRERVSGMEVDLSETVGWFTTLNPIQVPGTAEDSLVDTVKFAKDVRMRVPDKGRPYTACRYHSPAGQDAFGSHRDVEVLLNYRGSYQQLERRDALLQREDRPGRAVTLTEFGPDYQRMALVELNIMVQEGQARVSITTHRRMKHQARLEHWMQLYLDELKAAVFALAESPTSLTLADFPLLSISYTGLETLFSEQLDSNGIGMSDVEDIYPCTPLQEGIVISSKIGNASYRNNWIWQCVPGTTAQAVSPARLVAAWETVTRRHSIFSTIFVAHSESGRYVQVVLRDRTKRCTCESAGSLSATQYLQEMQRPIFSSCEPENAFTICHTPSGEVACRLDMSHSLIDASSIPVLIQDLVRAYAERELLEPPLFSDVVRHIQLTSRSSRLSYWKTHLTGVQPCEVLGDLHSRQGSGAPDYQYGAISIPTTITTFIFQFCRKRNITRSVFLQIAWSLVLSQFTGTREVCFGYVCSGRDTPIDGIEAVVGPLISMLVARVDLEQPLEDVLAAINEQSIEHLAHQHTSLAEIMHELPGDSGRLFNTAITVREVHQYGNDEEVHFVEMREEDPHEYDLLVSAALDGGDTEVCIQYRCDFMSVGYAEAVASGLEAAIEYLTKTCDVSSTEENLPFINRTKDEARIGPAPLTPSTTVSRSKGDECLYESYFEHIVGTNESSAIDYWRGQFEGLEMGYFPPLPSASHQPSANTAATHEIHGLDWCKPYMASSLIQASWAVLQAAYLNSTDVLVGMLTSVSAPAAMQVSMALPARIRFDREQSFSQMLDQVQSQAAESTRYARMNVQRIRRVSEEAAWACQFQTLLAVIAPTLYRGIAQETVEEDWHAENRKDYELHQGLGRTSPRVMTIGCFVKHSGVHLQVAFDDKVVGIEQVVRMLRQFECVLRWTSSPENLQSKVLDIETISDQDLRDIWGWNATVPETVNACVHDIFTQTVQRQPDTLAISAWDGDLTYSELDNLSTRLAHNLVEFGVGLDTIVPLYFEKSMWMPVAQLAVMKAGAASVALDSTQPIERVRSIVQEVKPNVVLLSKSSEEMASHLPTPSSVILDWKFIESLQALNHGRSLPRETGPADLLYVVFTSGSTGTPKGAMITHNNFATAIHYQQDAMGYRPGVRVYDFVSYAFDVTWSNALHTLTSGGCLCIPSELQRKNDITGSLQDSKATLVDLTPSMLRLLQPEHFPSLQRVLLSGESFTEADLGAWTNHAELINTYGPAECSVKATFSSVFSSPSQNVIGRGEGLLTWVVCVNEPRQLAPLGTIGELWLEGPLVGQGYLNDAVKTATAFIENPPWLLHGGPGYPGRQGRLYRTGDLVRYDSNGILNFVGRKDLQVKIRGQRVELGEVEHHLQNSLVIDNKTKEKVQVIAEVIKPRGSDNPTLIAFICIKDEEDVNATVWKATMGVDDKLRETVPAYMIPTAYIPVDNFPMTATGKTDRKRLRETGATMTLEQLAELHPSRSSDRRRPETATEIQLQGLWAAILGVDADSISLDDSFLRVGGDSIGAMRLVGAAREQGLRLTVADVFKLPHLSNLAKAIESQHSLPSTKLDVVPPFTLLREGLTVENARAQAASLCGVEINQVEDIFPCTPLQEGLLAMAMRRPGDYVLRQARVLRKDIDIERFRKAWEKVVQVMPILRTRIVHLHDQGLVQVIIKQDLQWRFGGDVDAMIQGDEECIIGLGTALTNYRLARSAKDGRSCFIWSMHHALFDGWSLPLILESLQMAYDGESLKEPVPLQSFVKYLSEHDDEVEAFWRGECEGIKGQQFPVLPSRNYQSKPDKALQFSIDNMDWGGDYTASTMIRAAWAILLSAYTNSTEAVFGATVSGRQAAVAGIEHIAGPTIATVPLRVAVNREMSVEELLQQVQLQSVEMTPFEQAGLQRIQHMSKDCEQACKFQSLLLVQPAERKDMQGTLFEQSRADNQSVMDNNDDFEAFNSYAITTECLLQPHGMRLRVSIDSSIIDAVYGTRIAEQFKSILRQICSASAHRQRKKVSQIETISDQDLRNIWDWNATVPEKVVACVHDLFAQIIQRQPEAPAICAWDGELTYWELDNLSTQLAHYLVQFGVGLNTIVPLYFEKSMWMPVAQLGVMKAGAASVALDSELSMPRLRAIIQQVEPRVILSSASNEALADQLSEKPVQVVDKQHILRLQGDGVADKKLPSISTSSRLYVVFTSGSTGTPKGAIVSHCNFASAIKHQQQDLGLDSQSRVYDFVSYAFDVSWSNILQTLCAGGCLCIPSQIERQEDPAKAIRRMRVNYAHLTPTVARLMQGPALPDLKTISFIGEPLRAADVAYWKNKVRIINTYGPAECTPVTTAQLIESDNGSDPSIGKGTGAQTWVVDAKDGQKLAAIGTVGELWLEGPLVGQGYLNDAVKTATAFIENPPWLLHGGPGYPGRQGRLYRTGDLVRYDSDGRLFYISRKDSQVKIRGQRIELGEIEHHLRLAFATLPPTQLVAEVITPVDSNAPILVAFLQYQHSQHGSEAKQRAILQDITNRVDEQLALSVPAYMIPIAYIPVKSIPMTASGKTDRRALRQSGASLKKEELVLSGHKERREPETPSEVRVHDLVARVLSLNHKDFGMDESFIRVGGDSITAMQLVSLAREEALLITIADVLTSQKLSDLTKKLDILSMTSSYILSSASSDGPIPFSTLGSINHNSFVEQEILPRVHCDHGKLSNVLPVSYTQKVYIEDALNAPRRSWGYFYVDFSPSVNTKRLVESCIHLINRHDIFRTVFVSSQGQLYQAIFESLSQPFEQLQSSNSIEDLYEEVCLQDLECPVTLGSPFMRFILLCEANVRVRLVLSMSHAFYDGISLSHIMRDLGAFYRGEKLPKARSFSSYMEHVVSHKAAGYNYWRGLLDGSSMTTIIPEVPPTILDGPPTIVDRSIPFPSLRPGVTPATLFTSACALMLAKLSGSSDVIFGRLMSTRSNLPGELQHLVGPCINTLPVRINFSKGQTNEDVLAAVQRQYIEGLPYETTGLDDIVTHCTQWPTSMPNFGCVTQFQNIDEYPLLDVPDAISRLDARNIMKDIPVLAAYLHIQATPHKDQLNLNVAAGPGYSHMVVLQILDGLCKILEC